MRRILLYVLCSLFCVTFLSAQNLWKLESGIHIDKTKEWGKINSVYFNVGTEYLDKGWFNLSSNIGILRHGIVYDVTNEAGNIIGITSSGTFLTLNTIFDIKKTSSDGYTFYLGAGPKLDVLLGSGFDSKYGHSEFDDSYLIELSPVVFGMRCELGVKKRFGKATDVGLVVAYQPSFTNVIKHLSFFNQSINVGLTIGYEFSSGKNTQGEKAAKRTLKFRR